ncbi:unnamed protein product [Rotaria sordida]|uniref:SAM domain-containing protein n=1 Tax=Rotaria sordida TaxID=392033 RepID=A0A813XZL4_9BILA|nr:unnamed protein product [Rotaria sordida]CAF0997391.1 unnamed protein product [Rotaria sordida]
MADWTIDQVGEWLIENGFENNVKTFKDKNIDGLTLMRMNDDNISQMLCTFDEDGIIEKPTTEVKTKFKEKLEDWKVMVELEQNKQVINNEIEKYSTRMSASSPSIKTRDYWMDDETFSNMGSMEENEEKAKSDDILSSTSSLSNVSFDLSKIDSSKQEILKLPSPTISPDKDQITDITTSIDKTKYLVNDNIHIQFFKNPKFGTYLIEYLQQKISGVKIKIEQSSSINDELFSSFNYILYLSGSNQDIESTYDEINNLFQTVKIKIYKSLRVRTWLRNPTAVSIIQAIMDNENNLFTVCQSNGKYNDILKIFYFHNEKFNYIQNIDNIIQSYIRKKIITLPSIVDKNMIEKSKKNTKHDTQSGYSTKYTEQYQNKLKEMMENYNEENNMISIILNEKIYNKVRKQQSIHIFGSIKLVNEFIQNFQNLADKDTFTVFKFNPITSIQMEYLTNIGLKDLKVIEKEYQKENAKIRIRYDEFYAPENLKNDIELSMNTLLSSLESITFECMPLYYDIADKEILHLKNIAHKNRCGCELILKKNLKLYRIPKAIETSSTINFVSRSLIKQSELFCSSPVVSQQAKSSNGSIEVLIGDIAVQKADVLIIPLVSYGLKQSLIERAGNIIRQEQPVDKTEKDKNSTPFFIETTASNLTCKIVLFSNWSPLKAAMNDDNLVEHIRKFISKSIKYVIMKNEQSDIKIESIAFAVPDSCKNENILAEEMIHETKQQIELMKSPLKISFIILPDQQTLYQQFLTAIQKVQSNDDVYAVFSCPMSTITVNLISSNNENLTKCKEKIMNHIKRSMVKIKLDEFKDWNQYMINVFYKYCYDRCVLLKIDDDKRIRLIGPINNVYEAKHKYLLTNALIQEKIHIQQLIIKIPRSRSIIQPQRTESISTSACYNIMLSYCQEDSTISHHLGDRLIDEGFSVWIDLIGSNDSFLQINKSECIILCISENYIENKFSQNTVEYMKQMGKHIILVKVQNCILSDWLQQLIPNEIYFQMFGSENYFDLQYDKLLLKILQYTQPGYSSLLQKTSHTSIILQQDDIVKSHRYYNIFNFLLTQKQRESNYQKYVTKLMSLKKGKINEDERKILINELEEIIRIIEDQCRQNIKEQKKSHYSYDDDQSNLQTLDDDELKEDELKTQILFDSGILSYQYMLKKALDLKTKQNIPPCTVSGDINDAPFPMIDEVLRNPKLIISTRVNRFQCGKFDSDYYKRRWTFNNRYLKSWRKPKKKSSQHLNDDKPNIQTITNETTSSHSSEMADKDRIRKFQDFGESRKTIKHQVLVKKDFPKKSTYSEQEIMEFRKKFVQQMKDNENELIKLCENINLLRRPSKQRIYANLNAMFSLSTVSDAKQKPIKALQTHGYREIPLKFPWNGVLDASASSLVQQNPSALFFFEVPQ